MHTRISRRKQIEQTTVAAAMQPSSTLSAAKLTEYYQLTKPGIVYSNTMMAASGFLFASKLHGSLGTLVILLAGTALLIACACVLNNFLDRRIDAVMARTSKRALVTGRISARNAILYATVLGVLGLIILFKTNWLTVGIGLGAVFSYVVLYGVAKRKTPFGTLVGTIPGAATLVAGYTAAVNHLGMAALLLFLIMATWQMAHFYGIALFRFEDYRKAGLPVWPVRYGKIATKLQIIAFIVFFILAGVALSLFGYAGLSFRVFILVAGIYWLYRGLHTWREADTSRWGRRMFGISLIVLLSFAILLPLSTILP